MSEEDELNLLLFRPELTPRVDPEQFAFALQLGSAASTYRMPMESPSKMGVGLEMPDGTVQQIRFTDVPLNRLALAIREHFGPDRKTFASVMTRFFALQRLWKNNRMKKWVRKVEGEPGAREVNEAVFTAAATLAVNAQGRFDENLFFKKVEEIAKVIDEEDAAKSTRA